MSLNKRIEAALALCRDQKSFFQKLLNETLEWPLGGVGHVEEIAYSWSADELKIAGLEHHVVDGHAWQIQPLQDGQPWGIFVLEFKNSDAFTTARGMAGVLRKILRALVASRRKDASTPSWKREHLLFICTYRWERYKFAYFRSKFGESRGTRLTTFGWEPGKSSRTVCEFNLPALEWPADPTNTEKWVAEWVKAFDKERLTKDFFKRFDEALERIKGDLQKLQNLKPAEAYTQAQLLLERLIFLYFLQNRGWLNQDRRYLPNHLEEFISKPEAFTYYKDFLDKVFWALSTPPGSSGGRLSGIPFLNGGLFDDDEFSQPNETRKTNPPLKVRNQTFQFVFNELLEAFNFTVTEDTPLNQEVAVDPEMLGKVFESIVLHAEQADPDATAPDKRKATGSYYTPRIVVHFICQEVLYQYLHNHLPPLKGKDGWGPKLRTLLSIDASNGLDDDELEMLKKTITAEQAVQIRDLVNPLKCCDPAVGSGAFPVGLLHELVNFRRLLEASANGYVDPARGEGSTWLQKTQQDVVQNCLFGVDIQQQAIEICRLRLWLSLVVNYDLGLDPFNADKTQFTRAISGISQLPNLEMNFHRGDGLHDHISGVPIVIIPEKANRHAPAFQSIADLADQLHYAKRAERKRKLRLNILEKRLDLSHDILSSELKALETSESALDTLFHDETESSAFKRKRIAQEKGRLQDALAKISRDRKDLEKLDQREYDGQFYVKLRKLEGADFDSPLNFVWCVDFPTIFAGRDGSTAGFDIIVGNPPFVSARNPVKRKLWSDRWPAVCHKNYLLVCPFFELSFGILTANGQLGFIVSNSFAKREFGQALIEDFLSTVEIQKLVDCSGLMFPGHGTPTCLVFGSSQPPDGAAVKVVGILPGGGDLRTPPEDSPLWQNIENHHDDSGFSNDRIAVSDRTRAEIDRWPWSFIRESSEPTKDLNVHRLADYAAEPIGAQFITGKDEAFIQPPDYFRRIGLDRTQIRRYGTGEDIRDWTVLSTEQIIFPYTENLNPLQEPLPSPLSTHLLPHKELLENSIISSSTKKKETNLKWFEFRRLARAKFKARLNIVVPQIATHAHFAVSDHSVIFKEKAPAVVLRSEFDDRHYHVIAGLLNSSFILDWLKKECFSKREADEAETDTYYEFSGGKLEEVPICQSIADSLNGNWTDLTERLTSLSQSCAELGKQMPSLTMHKLFEKPGEAYQEWNCRLLGYIERSDLFGAPFDSTTALRESHNRAQTIRDGLREKMIGLQEEMDWLIYLAYGLLPVNHPAVQVGLEPSRLERDQRPFALWTRAKGNYEKARELIPSGWPTNRKDLWRERLSTIRDNDDIRRIEQSVYKRRWDEQWKLGNQWRCGPIAYSAEFVDAFEWWLREKGESWLEQKKHGGPIELEEWAQALWKDTRARAAWPVAAEEYKRLEYEKVREKAVQNGEPAPTLAPPDADFASFKLKFREIIDEETVPEGFSFATPYDDLEKTLRKDVPAKLKKVRGKLNVPRERFHLRGKSQYLWAGLQFK
jgi:type I restriction-modification system DNA methylase subunit